MAAPPRNPDPRRETDADGADNFLSRWSRRKVQVARGVPVADLPAAPAPAARQASALTAQPASHAPDAAADSPARAPESPAPPAPTLDDVALLRRDADFSPFVQRGVAPDVKNAALRKLFSDPHFNVMDGLDTYIDDYGKPDPLPPGMLRKMVGSQLLGLFDHERKPEADPEPGAAAALSDPAPPPAALPEPDTHEDPDLRLQPDDDAGRAGVEPGPVEDGGRQR